VPPLMGFANGLMFMAMYAATSPVKQYATSLHSQTKLESESGRLCGDRSEFGVVA
jgi:hypothetical protein